MSIPLVNLKRNFEAYRSDYERVLIEAAGSCQYVLGGYVAAFEEELAAYVGVRHAIGVGSGTAALTLILKGMQPKPGAVALTQPNTFVATALAIRNAGMELALCDVDVDTHLMDPKSYVGEEPSVVMPVHLYGRPTDPAVLRERFPNASIVEDACQAHGASIGGVKCGGLGLAGALSFYPGKNLGAFGDGGAVLTNDDGLAEEIRALRNWGGARKYVHDRPGGNSRLDGIQAAILSFKLKHLDEWNRRREQLAETYMRKLAGVPGLQLPASVPAESTHAWHLFVVRVAPGRRDALLAHLHEAGVGAGIHYPRCVHRQKVYESLPIAQQAFPVAERMADEIISLPLCPNMRDEECLQVCETVAAFMERGAEV